MHCVGEQLPYTHVYLLYSTVAWEIPESELVYQEGDTALGQGEFGEVNVASYRGMQVAVKTLQEKKLCPEATESFLQEATVIT